MKMKFLDSLAASASAIAVLSATPAFARDSAPAEAAAQEASDDGGLGDIIVTGRKKSAGEAAQSVPIAITAVTGASVEEKALVSLTQVAQSVPNVAMDEIGSLRGTANFSIRGLGANSTLPTLESATGTFIDGIYLANNQGVILDLFDLEGIEILRGPQGTLFGKNVTGGAVLIRSALPRDHFEAGFKASIETGPEYKLAGYVTGPISSTLKARLAVYYDNDKGWFTNLFNDKPMGAARTFMIRPSITWSPSSAFDLTLRYEHGKTDGQGYPSQNQALYDRNSFDFAVNFMSPNDLKWDMFTSEANLQIGPGTLTNVAGYRFMRDIVETDVDGTGGNGFNQRFDIRVKQFSDELRYAFDIGDFANITAGLYYFHSNISTIETRRIQTLGFVPRVFGGYQYQNLFAAFAQGDFKLAEPLTLTLGGRYSVEKKRADIAFFSATTNKCDEATRACTFDLNDVKDTWKSFSPKLGLQYTFNPHAQIYASVSRAYRAGGYNLRITNPAQTNKFNQESTTAFEIGGKADFFDRHLRVNGALFVNKIDNMIRDVNTFVGAVLVQDTKNTADATIWGTELEIEALVAPGLTLNGFLGYQHGKYDKVRSDLSGDGVIDQRDLDLKLVRLAPWSFGAGFNYTHDLSETTKLGLRANFSHRDWTFSNDANQVRLNEVNNLDAGASVDIGNMKVSVFGRNLLNRAYQGIVFALPAAVIPVPVPPGSQPTFASLSEGRVVGVEFQIKF